jgi:hypothetical protein
MCVGLALALTFAGGEQWAAPKNIGKSEITGGMLAAGINWAGITLGVWYYGGDCCQNTIIRLGPLESTKLQEQTCFAKTGPRSFGLGYCSCYLCDKQAACDNPPLELHPSAQL